MKICLINNLYQPFNRGGAERVTETIAAGLLKAGQEVFIITTKPYFSELRVVWLRQIWQSQTSCELRVYYLNSLYYNLHKFPKFLRLVWHLWNMFNFVSYFKIKKILRAEKCEAVITNNLMGLGFLTPLAIRSLKIKHLHIAHDIQLIHPSGLLYYGRENIINGYFARNYAGLMNWLIDSPEIVIFPSRWLLDAHLDKIFFIKSKRLILPNPVKAVTAAGRKETGGNFNPVKYASRPNHRLGFNGVKFLFIGQIEEHKGVFLLVEAFKKIKARFGRANLIIAGSGELAGRLKSVAADENINFLARVSEEKVDDLIAKADCLVYPSLVYENCPNVIQRALAVGRLVIASDLGGISELLSKNAGLLFKPADEKALADKMAWVINNKNNLSAIIDAGKAKAELFKVDNYIKELLRLMV